METNRGSEEDTDGDMEGKRRNGREKRQREEEIEKWKGKEGMEERKGH